MLPNASGSFDTSYTFMLKLQWKNAFGNATKVFDTELDKYTHLINENKSNITPRQKAGLVADYAIVALSAINVYQKEYAIENVDDLCGYVSKIMDHPNAPHNLYPEVADDIAYFLSEVYIHYPEAWTRLGYSVGKRYGSGATIAKYMMNNHSLLTYPKDHEFDELIRRMKADRLSHVYMDDNVMYNAFTTAYNKYQSMSVHPVYTNVTERYHRCMQIFYMFVDNGMDVNAPGAVQLWNFGSASSKVLSCASKLGISEIEKLLVNGYNLKSANIYDVLNAVYPNPDALKDDTAETRLALLLNYGLNPYNVEDGNSVIKLLVFRGERSLVELIVNFNFLNAASNGSTVLDKLLEYKLKLIRRGDDDDPQREKDMRDDCIALIRIAGGKMASEL